MACRGASDKNRYHTAIVNFAVSLRSRCFLLFKGRRVGAHHRLRHAYACQDGRRRFQAQSKTRFRETIFRRPIYRRTRMFTSFFFENITLSVLRAVFTQLSETLKVAIRYEAFRPF